MEEKKCTGDHSIHICELAGQNKFDEIRKIAKSPNYMCFKCGRVADLEENLCYSVAFDEIPKLKKIYVTK
jgi:hypothetical protein